jgi:GNAT superfamily N-acetyltransferase
MSSNGSAPRRAKREELPTLARTLAAAFADDPVQAWACRSETMRPWMLERFFGARLRQLFVRDEVWTTDQLNTVALWAPPGHWKTTVREDIELGRPLLHPRLVLRMPLVVRGLLGVEAKHPAEPLHWYLAALGTEPAARGQGLGSAVLRPILEECDRDGVPAYLESSNAANHAFYGRHGFRITGELRLPRGPLVWQMWREPRS